nr:hypothetical protein [Tanacetum cinerariifolium]
RARIAQSSALPTAAVELASPIGDDSQGEACPTVSGLEAEQDRANITKTSTLPSDSTLRVTSLAADEGTSVLSSGVSVSISPVTEVSVAEVPTGSGSIPTPSAPGTRVPTSVVPNASPIFTTAIVATPYTRRKGKEKMVESEKPKKKKLQEQMDVEMARQLEEEMKRDA